MFRISVKQHVWIWFVLSSLSNLRFWFQCKQFIFHVRGFRMSATGFCHRLQTANTKITNSKDLKRTEVFHAKCQQTLVDLTFDGWRESSFYAQKDQLNFYILYIFSSYFSWCRTWLTTGCGAHLSRLRRIPGCPGPGVSSLIPAWNRGTDTTHYHSHAAVH